VLGPKKRARRPPEGPPSRFIPKQHPRALKTPFHDDEVLIVLGNLPGATSRRAQERQSRWSMSDTKRTGRCGSYSKPRVKRQKSNEDNL
jgi:hypothetical protein